jgi:hypothetical protein
VCGAIARIKAAYLGAGLAKHGIVCSYLRQQQPRQEQPKQTHTVCVWSKHILQMQSSIKGGCRCHTARTRIPTQNGSSAGTAAIKRLVLRLRPTE